MRKDFRPFSAALFAMSLLASGCGDNSTDGTTDAGSTGADDHHSLPIAVPAGMAVPTISIEAQPDRVSGYNLFIDLSDFILAPEHASTEPVDGEGHLHLYIDGERRLRFYNRALYLDGLPAGDHEVMVEVSANNHAAYAVGGDPIRASTTISVDPSSDTATHGHDGTELFESADPPTLEVTVSKDPKTGWNLMADVTGMVFDPRAVGSAPVDGHGHLHLYIDGEKVTRLYGPWWHIDGLAAGPHDIVVEASANDHSTYASNGQPVTAVTTLTVDGSDAAMDGAMDGAHGDEHPNGSTVDDGAGHGHERSPPSTWAGVGPGPTAGAEPCACGRRCPGCRRWRYARER